MLLADSVYIIVAYSRVRYCSVLMKGSLSVDLEKYIDRNTPSDDCKMVLLF